MSTSRQSLISRVADAHLRRVADLVGMRSTYLPKHLRGTPPTEDPEGTDMAIWFWEEGGKYLALAFQGNQSKPIVYNSFRDDGQRKRYVDSFVESRKRSIQMKEEARKKRREFSHDLKVGDIVYTSWGYDQTNIDFFQVVEVKGKSAVIREIGAKTVRDDGPYTEVVAVKDAFKGPPMVKVVGPNGMKVDNHYTYKWDGKPVYQTGWGYGH